MILIVQGTNKLIGTHKIVTEIKVIKNLMILCDKIDLRIFTGNDIQIKEPKFYFFKGILKIMH